MTQHEALIDLFRKHNNVLTLGQIMQTTLGCEYRARISELRRKGYTITLERGDTPSENTYRLIPPYQVDEQGQVLWA